MGDVRRYGESLTARAPCMHGRCMATKTISIDLEAYRALKRRKRKGQSFSDVIKEHFSGGISARHFAEVVRGTGVAERTLDAIDDLVDRRRADPAGAPDL